MAVALSSTCIQKVILHLSLPLVAFIFKPNQTNLSREFWPPNSFGETISRGPHWRKRGTWVKPGTCYPVLLPLDSHQPPPPAANQPFCHPQTQTKPLLGVSWVNVYLYFRFTDNALFELSIFYHLLLARKLMTGDDWKVSKCLFEISRENIEDFPRNC